ncbi:MAG: acetylornithine transaminase [Defluviitaleaceae bacterium]|nr:acetylornithine transaminase [Defluviitaleaceae bacterium]
MLMDTYNRYPVTFVRGEGSRLIDEKGKSYLDFATGIGVSSVGHAHPDWLAAIYGQASQLCHVSNLYHTKPAAELAKKIADISGLVNVFFSNSGAEANEGMIKMARKYSLDNFGENRAAIVTLKNSFHGRTITTLSATGQDVFHKNYFPFTDGFLNAPAADADALASMKDCAAQNAGKICAVLVEAVQGEGGVIPFDEKYLLDVADICRANDWLLLFDEVQTGIGRTGTWFSYQSVKGLLPDGVSFAKGIAGGLPLGGFIAGSRCAGTLRHGDHASTFGGNPVNCAAALAVLKIIEAELPTINERGEMLRRGLASINGFTDARGKGLMVGATIGESIGSAREATEKLLENGLTALTAGGNSLRLMPPLTVTAAEINEGIEIIRKVFA